MAYWPAPGQFADERRVGGRKIYRKSYLYEHPDLFRDLLERVRNHELWMEEPGEDYVAFTPLTPRFEAHHLKPEPQGTTMNFSTTVFLINPNARAVRCSYEPTPEEAYAAQRTTGHVIKEYVFKTIDASIKKGDLVVVPTDTRHGFTVVKVTEEDVEVNMDSPIELKWIVKKVDLDEYQKLLDMEKDTVAVVRRADMRSKREKLAEDLFKNNLEEIKALGLATAGALPAAEEPKKA